MTRTTPFFIACTLGLLACGNDDQLAEGDSSSEGEVTYRDAETEADGSPKEPAAPEEDSGPPMWVEVVVDAAAELDVSDPSCSLDGLGNSLEVLYSGEAVINDDGTYVAVFSSSEAEIIGAPECTLPDLSISAVTGVSVQGWYETTTQRCETYCESSARAEAEQACEGSSDEASCRAEAEAEHEASCTTSCEDAETYAIFAEASLGADQVAEVSTNMVSGDGMGSISADLRFEALVDSEGNTVSEN